MPPRLGYAAFMLLAATVFVSARWLLPKPPDVARLPRWQRTILTLPAFVGGSLGAKLPFVLGTDPLSGAAWLTDGKTITTALVGAYLTVEVVKVILGIHAHTGDGYAIPLALALAVGRWGCYVNGCCYGTETDLPWGVDFGDGVRRHPTQAYESLFHLAMAGVLLLCLVRGWFTWQRLKVYLIAYGVYRFATELIRPEPAWWLGLTFYQWVALAIIVAMAVQWRFHRLSAEPE